VLGVALIAGANAAGAQAHASEILIGASTLVYEQRPAFHANLNNNVAISLKSDSLGAYYEVYDPQSTGIVFPPSQCVPLDEAQEDIRCPASGIDAIYVRVGTGTGSSSTTDNITISAPTPATVSGGSVTNAGGARTSNITVGPVGGNIIYGNPGTGTLKALNGFADTIHSCPGNVVEDDLADTVIADCAPPPEPPVSPPPEPTLTPTPKPTATTPAPSSPAAGKQPATPAAAPTQSAAIVLRYKQPQAILGRRVLKFGVSVARPMVVHARGTIALPGRGGTANLTSTRARITQIGVAVALQIHVPSRTLSKLRNAFRHHRRLYASVQVDATDPVSGIEYSIARVIALVR
jgi:hypothetical protein